MPFHFVIILTDPRARFARHGPECEATKDEPYLRNGPAILLDVTHCWH